MLGRKSKPWLFTIYIDKPVGPWFTSTQNSGLANSYRNRVYHFYTSVSFTEKRPRSLETGNKDGFEKMEHEFPFGIFRSEKQASFSDVPLLPELFRRNDLKSRVPVTLQPDFPQTFCKW